VAAVDCGEAALDALLRGEADAGILAPDLPAIPGLEVAKLLRFATIGRARPPLVALVDRSDARLERACREAGFDACLARPLSPEAAAAALAEALAVPEPAPCLARAGVARIDAHPDFARGARTLDPAVLADLEALGGPTFLAGLAAGFIADMDEIRDGLDALAAAGAAGPFRERIHALRSAAAQIGALRLYRFCLAWRGISPRQLRAAEAAGRLRALDREIARARRALLPYVDRAAGRTA
jgi:two-component system sensor histidine kinase RpfC